MAIVYHSVYNTLIQSEYKYLGAAMPMVTYLAVIVILVIVYKKNINKNLKEMT
ncbi:MAG: hypothetical protein UIH27_04120 [Ruminococcus sp.]|nr:hypothetical protein [Ruminococcus sp.]